MPAVHETQHVEADCAPCLRVEDMDLIAVVFGVVSRAFWEEPQAGIVHELAESRAELGGSPFNEISPLGAPDLQRALDAYAKNPEEQMALIRQDRAYLFYEIGYSRTSPYESAYRTPDRTLFGPTTEQVKRDFERHGLSVNTGSNEPSDHFALECSYIQSLALAAVEAANEGDRAAYEGVCAEIRRFMGEHLLVFAPIYLENFMKRASTVFYRSLGEFALESIKWAADITGAEPSDVLNIEDFPLKVRRAGKEY